MYTLAHHRQGFAGCELAGVPQRTTRSGDPAPRQLYFDYLPCLRLVWAIPVTWYSGRGRFDINQGLAAASTVPPIVYSLPW